MSIGVTVRVAFLLIVIDRLLLALVFDLCEDYWHSKGYKVSLCIMFMRQLKRKNGKSCYMLSTAEDIP